MPTPTDSYRIRKSFLIPMGLVVVLSLVLLISSIQLRLPLAKTLILGLFLLPAVAIFAESCRRRITLGATTLIAQKLVRRKTFAYSELTSVDTIKVRRRVFLSLSSENDFVIISNSYERFDELVAELIARSPAQSVSDETRRLAENPAQKSNDVFSAWLVAAVLLFIIYIQLKGSF